MFDVSFDRFWCRDFSLIYFVSVRSFVFDSAPLSRRWRRASLWFCLFRFGRRKIVFATLFSFLSIRNIKFMMFILKMQSNTIASLRFSASHFILHQIYSIFAQTIVIWNASRLHVRRIEIGSIVGWDGSRARTRWLRRHLCRLCFKRSDCKSFCK